MKTAEQAARRDRYQRFLNGNIPLYTTRLIRLCDTRYEDRHRIQSPEDLYPILKGYFKDKDREEVIVVLLDSANTIIGYGLASIGTIGMATLSVAEVFRFAIVSYARSIILAHNHMSGNLQESREDVRATKTIKEAGKLLGIELHDHLITTQDGFISMAERGLL